MLFHTLSVFCVSLLVSPPPDDFLCSGDVGCIWVWFDLGHTSQLVVIFCILGMAFAHETGRETAKPKSASGKGFCVKSRVQLLPLRRCFVWCPFGQNLGPFGVLLLTLKLEQYHQSCTVAFQHWSVRSGLDVLWVGVGVRPVTSLSWDPQQELGYSGQQRGVSQELVMRHPLLGLNLGSVWMVVMVICTKRFGACNAAVLAISVER